MEDGTRRIRQARVQGLDAPSELSRATRRRGVSRSPTRGLDLPAEPRADVRSTTATSARKTNRTTRSTTRRPATRSR